MSNEENDALLAEMLDTAIEEIGDGNPFAWFETRGISTEAIRDLGQRIEAETTSGETAAIVAFMCGWLMNAGRTAA